MTETSYNWFGIGRFRAIFSQPFARILVRFVLPHFWLYLFVGFHDRYVIKAFRTAYLVELTKNASYLHEVHCASPSTVSLGYVCVPLLL